jgi:extracellular elastinolytic metalloproteinase
MMVSFSALFASVFIAIVYASASLALVTPIYSRHATHGAVRNFRPLVSRSSFSIEPRPIKYFAIIRFPFIDSLISLQTFGAGIDDLFSKHARPSIEDSTVSFVASQLKVDASAIKFRDGFSADTAQPRLCQSSACMHARFLIIVLIYQLFREWHPFRQCGC